MIRSMMLTKSRIFLFSLLAFLAGVGVQSFLVRSFLLGSAVGIGVAALVCAGALVRRKRSIAIVALFFLTFLIGMTRMSFVRVPTIADEMMTQSVEMDIRVRAVSDWGLDAARIDADASHVNKELLDTKLEVRIRTHRYPEYAIGDELLVRGMVKPPLHPHDLFYLSYPKIEKLYESNSFTAARMFGRMRNVLNERIEAILPEPHASLLKGLLLGEKQSLPQDFIDELKRSGTSHIVALSGYNITIVGRTFMAVLLAATVPFMISFWLAMGAIMGFIFLTGASASLVRAGIMGILALVAEREGYLYRMTNALVFAGAAMVMHDPTLLRFDVSFQLSFLATLGLVMAAPVYTAVINRVMRMARSQRNITRMPYQDNEKPSTLKNIFIETLAAQTMVTPLLLYHFGTFSFISPLANLSVLLSIPYTMGIGFAGVVASFVWEGLGRVVGYFAWILLEYQMRAISLFAAFPFAAVDIPGFSEGMLVVSYVMLALVLWRMRFQKKI